MKYIVFGSGGLAKELIGYLLDDGHEVVKVVSTEPFNNPEFKYEVAKKAGVVKSGVRFLLAVADSGVKRKIVSENEDLWDSYFHRSCYVSRYAKIGRGVVLAPQALVVGDGEVGDFVFLNINVIVAHDSKVGHYSSLMPNAAVLGGCLVGEDVFIGTGAYVLPGKNVGDGAKLSAGSVVRHNVQEQVTVYGDPARPKAA